MTRYGSRFAAALALVLMCATAPPAGAQGGSCRQVLATATVSGNSYAVVAAPPFDGRVFVYAPAITAAGGGFQPFQLWVVEGLYGQPFVRPSGALSPSDFNRLRASRNVRASAVAVSRGTGAEATAIRVGKNTYLVQVRGVSAAGGGAVRIQACSM